MVSRMSRASMRKARGTKANLSLPAVEIAVPVTTAPPSGPCCVCGLRDARALLDVTLAGGATVALCGSHDLAHRRAGSMATSAAELKAMLGDRRRDDRRAHGFEEVDELAASLFAAFTSERRRVERRAI